MTIFKSEVRYSIVSLGSDYGRYFTASSLTMFRTIQQASPLTSDLQSRQVPNSPNKAYICSLQFASLGTKYYRTVEDLPNAHVHSEDLGHTLVFHP